MPTSRVRRLVACALAATALAAGCGGDDAAEAEAERADVVIASYDFAENQLLGEVAAAALRRTGLEVHVLAGMGTREVVAPALEQGYVDLVVDYLGTALDFLQPGGPRSYSSPEQAHAALQDKFEVRGVAVLPYATAEDKNGFAMTATKAQSLGITAISDLAAHNGELVLGGPSECPARRLCLAGLEERYGLEFARFRAMPSRADTAVALDTGEIDVGMLETTDPRLFGGELLLLEDDRLLQPPEHVVPLVRQEVLDEHGDRIVPALQAVTAALTTEELLRLNRAVQIEELPVTEVVDAWLDEHVPAS